MASSDQGLTIRRGRFVIDVPRSAGYFGGVGLAVGLGVLDPPLGLFIAAVPFFKMLNVAGASRPVRLVSQFYDGMAKPVGGDGQGTIALSGPVPRALTKTAPNPARRPRSRARAAGHPSPRRVR